MCPTIQVLLLCQISECPLRREAGPTNYPPASLETVLAKPVIECEQIINTAHKLASLQAYNILQVDNKGSKSFPIALP